ncbi:hypothetical protein HYT23_05470 [Candidatus Pacearchaeota archaeon]|nr:hypothetical protein [Candidatus Pacearchaeota archaeon]
MSNLFSKLCATGAVILGTSGIIGCGHSGQERYEFNGRIDGEWVEFRTSNNLGEYLSRLMISGRADGVEKWYYDYRDNDLKIEEFAIDSFGVYTRYYIYPKQSLKPLGEYQQEFELYLSRILAVKDSLKSLDNTK